MRVCMIKTDPKLKTALIVAALALFTALCVVSAVLTRADRERTAYGASLKDEQAAAEYLRAVGEADAAQLSCEPVLIPAEFEHRRRGRHERDDRFGERQCGRDLSEYKGEQALQFRFALSGENASYAVLLVRDGDVIGGHLTDGEYGGDYLPLRSIWND